MGLSRGHCGRRGRGCGRRNWRGDRQSQCGRRNRRGDRWNCHELPGQRRAPPFRPSWPRASRRTGRGPCLEHEASGRSASPCRVSRVPRTPRRTCPTPGTPSATCIDHVNRLPETAYGRMGVKGVNVNATAKGHALRTGLWGWMRPALPGEGQVGQWEWSARTWEVGPWG